MNASNARAFTAVKQKVKKLLKEFEKDVKRFQEVCCGPDIFQATWILKACVGS